MGGWLGITRGNGEGTSKRHKVKCCRLGNRYRPVKEKGKRRVEVLSAPACGAKLCQKKDSMVTGLEREKEISYKLYDYSYSKIQERLSLNDKSHTCNI